MKARQQMFLAMGGLVLLSGCVIGNLTDWADDTFYQSQTYKEDEAVVKRYLKGIRLYDQFETVAIFDALWNSDEVRTVYSRLYAKVMGKDEESELAFLKRQLSADTYSIAFYVLSPTSIPLTVTPPTWVVYVEIDGKRYLPAEIKVAELPGEYVMFFGKRLTAHKQPYEVKFDRKDSEGNDILIGKKMIKLFFSNPRYFGSVGWQLDEQGHVTDQVVLDRIPVKKEPAPTKKQRSLERRGKKKEAEHSSLTSEEPQAFTNEHRESIEQPSEHSAVVSIPEQSQAHSVEQEAPVQEQSFQEVAVLTPDTQDVVVEEYQDAPIDFTDQSGMEFFMGDEQGVTMDEFSI